MTDNPLTPQDDDSIRMEFLGRALDQSGDLPGARRIGRDRLMTQIEFESDRTRSHPTRKRPFTKLLAAAAVIAAGLLVLPVLLPGKDGQPTKLGLLSIAEASARTRLAPVLGSGDYWYSGTQGVERRSYVAGDGLSWSILVPVTTENWIATDGSGLSIKRTGKATFATPADRRRWADAGELPLPAEGVTRHDSAAGDLTFRDFSYLPADPANLLSALESRDVIGGPAGDAETLAIIEDLLREPTVTPLVRASLFQIAGDLDGVRVEEGLTDSLGRPGAALEMGDAESGKSVLFSPQTSEILELQEWESPDLDQREITTFLASGVVDELEDRPRG